MEGGNRKQQTACRKVDNVRLLEESNKICLPPFILQLSIFIGKESTAVALKSVAKLEIVVVYCSVLYSGKAGSTSYPGNTRHFSGHWNMFLTRTWQFWSWSSIRWFRLVWYFNLIKNTDLPTTCSHFADHRLKSLV